MSGLPKLYPTSVRFDEFQRLALERLRREHERSVSWLVSKAIDRYVEEELHMTRDVWARVSKTAYSEQLLRSFQPKPFVIPASGLPDDDSEAIGVSPGE